MDNLDMSDSFHSLSSTSEPSNIDDSFSSLPSLNESLKDTFINTSKNFNVAHINAQSIPAHYPDFLSSFTDVHLHAILVSESWLRPCLASAAYSLPGYRLIRNDRSNRRGGGVAIYLRSNMSSSVVLSSLSTDEEAEFIFLEVTLSHSKLLLGVFYSPSPSINYFQQFEKHLEDLVPMYNNTIIMGDFNTCLNKNNWRANNLRNAVSAVNLHILPLTATHFPPNSSPSLLDLILVSSPNLVEKYGQYNAIAFSYHDLIYLSYKIRSSKPKARVILQRCFGAIDMDSLLADASQIDWVTALDAPTPTEQVEKFNSLLIQLYDVHAPIRSTRLKHLPAPWLTDDIKKILNSKNKMKNKYRRCPTEENRQSFKTIRNHCNKLCRDSRRKYIHKAVLEEKDSARVWKFLKTIGLGKSPSDYSTDNINLNSLNLHYSATQEMDNETKLSTLKTLTLLNPIPSYPPFKFTSFTEKDVKTCVLSIHSNAVGCDNVDRRMITLVLDHILPTLTSILNNSIFSSVFPAIWKKAEIIPVPKKQHPSSFSDYRPISILPFLSKVLERLAYSQLNSFLADHNLLNPLQSGFRSGHSTTTALIKITDDIRMGMDYRRLTVLVLLDFSNAFGTIDPDILLALLRSANISTAALEWFKSYLINRSHRVKSKDEYSKWCTSTTGVPQGGILSPLLFALFINHIGDGLNSSFHLYADDLQVYAQTSLDNLKDTIDIVNRDLARILLWSQSYGLTINPTKTQVCLMGSKKLISKVDFSEIPPIILDGFYVPFMGDVKNLGIIMDQNMSWAPQINNLSRKIFGSLATLRRLRYFLPISTKIALAQSLLLPILDYGDICYLDASEEQLNKLERLQNVCIRFIFDLRKYDHVSAFRKQLKWLPIRLRRDAHVLSLLYCLLFSPDAPRYLKERIEFLHEAHNRALRSSYNLLLKIPAHSSSGYHKSFSVQAPRIWNSLPLNIRNADSLAIFKKMVKSFFLTQC